MPIETKKSTANASRNSSRSAPIWCLKGDSRTTTPATNAPSASEIPNAFDEASAVPTASVRATRTKSSRDPAAATVSRIAGMIRLPMKSITARKINALTMETTAMDPPATQSELTTAGRNTRIATVATSSRTSQPTATRPWTVSSAPMSVNARTRTTVLATEIAAPSTSAELGAQPQRIAIKKPMAAAPAIWRSAAGITKLRTAQSSSSAKCRPTPNMRRMIPNSASSRTASTSSCNPGVNGPRATPATR